LDDVGEMGKTAQLVPALFRALPELEHHMQHAVSAETALGVFGPVPDCGERAFDPV